jgi:RNA polymerase sigma-32 factor
MTLFEQECARVSRQAPLTEEEEQALVQRWCRDRDREAGERLVRAHYPLVLRLARRLRGYGVPREELVSEGNVGLLKGLEQFEQRGVRFKTYATYWIRAYMLALVQRHDSLVTRGTGAVGAKFFFRLRSARARAEALLGPKPDEVDALLARQFGVTVEQIREHTARLGARDVSLDVKVNDDGDTTALDLLPSADASPEERATSVQRDELVSQVVSRLARAMDPRERAVLQHRLLDDEGGVTLSELGGAFNLSRERLRQVELRLKKRLKSALDAAGVGAALQWLFLVPLEELAGWSEVAAALL